MQRVTLTRTLRGIDNEGKAIFDYLLYAQKDTGEEVETTLRSEDTGIIKDLENYVESFVTKEDEFEILKKTVEFMNLSMIGSEEAPGADLPAVDEVVLPPMGNGDLPSLDGIELPPDIELPEDVEVTTDGESPTEAGEVPGEGETLIEGSGEGSELPTDTETPVEGSEVPTDGSETPTDTTNTEGAE